jgi:hypothetical protein
MVLDLCKERKVSCHVLWQDELKDRYLAPDEHGHMARDRGAAVCFSFSNGHFNLYKPSATASICHYKLRRVETTPTMRALHDGDREPVVWDVPDYRSCPGDNFEATFVDSQEDFEEIRRRLILDGCAPKMTMATLTRPRALNYARNGKKVKVMVYTPAWSALREPSERLHLELCSVPSSCGSWALDALKQLLCPKRKYLTREMIRRQLKAMEAADPAYFARLKERYEKSKTK